MVGYARERQMMGCSGDSQCMTEISGALGVDRLLTGSISKLGKSIVVSFTLFNEKKGAVEARYSKRIREAIEEALLDVIAPAIETLFKSRGKPPPAEPAILALASAPPPAPLPSPEALAVSAEPRSESTSDSRPLLLAVRFQGAPNFGTLQGAIIPQVGYRLGNAFCFSAGPIISKPFGVLARAAWVPVNQDGVVRPFIALELPAEPRERPRRKHRRRFRASALARSWGGDPGAVLCRRAEGTAARLGVRRDDLVGPPVASGPARE